MSIQSYRRAVAFVTGGSAIAAPIAFLASPAIAVDQSCSGVSGAVEVLPGVCELRFDTAGEYSFNPPEGVAKVAAVLVGAGGGGLADFDDANANAPFVPTVYIYVYGGGGGEVIYIDDIGSGESAIEVGAGAPAVSGDPETFGSGGATSLGNTTARGGQTSDWDYPALSGNENGLEYELVSNWDWLGVYPYRSSVRGTGGGGAKAAPSEESFGESGAGFKISELDSVDLNLFPADDAEPVYGVGGPLVDETEYVSGPAMVNSSFSPAGVNGVLTPGSGGPASYDMRAEADGGFATGSNGADGMVLLRWLGEDTTEDSQETLPETGANYGPWTLAAAVASMVGGLGILGRTRRRTNA